MLYLSETIISLKQCPNGLNKVHNTEQSAIINLNNCAKFETLSKFLKQSSFGINMLYNVPIHLICIFLMMVSPTWLVKGMIPPKHYEAGKSEA